jgi:hypothetical protein
MRKPPSAITYTEQLQRIVADYIGAGEEWPAAMRQVANWALNHRRWPPQHDSLVSRCAEELARALREEYIIDPQGRTVRAKTRCSLRSRRTAARVMGRHPLR